MHYAEMFVVGLKQKVVLDDTDLHEQTLRLMEDARKVGRALTYGDAMIEADKLIRSGAKAA